LFLFFVSEKMYDPEYDDELREYLMLAVDTHHQALVAVIQACSVEYEQLLREQQKARRTIESKYASLVQRCKDEEQTLATQVNAFTCGKTRCQNGHHCKTWCTNYHTTLEQAFIEKRRDYLYANMYYGTGNTAQEFANVLSHVCDVPNVLLGLIEQYCFNVAELPVSYGIKRWGRERSLNQPWILFSANNTLLCSQCRKECVYDFGCEVFYLIGLNDLETIGFVYHLVCVPSWMKIEFQEARSNAYRSTRNYSNTFRLPLSRQYFQTIANREQMRSKIRSSN
jgi:hypothetical protein